MVRWSSEAKSEAIGLALAIGAGAASAQLGIPRRTITKWLSEPESDRLYAEYKELLGVAFADAFTAGMREMVRVLQDPRQSPVRKAKILRIMTFIREAERMGAAYDAVAKSLSE